MGIIGSEGGQGAVSGQGTAIGLSSGAGGARGRMLAGIFFLAAAAAAIASLALASIAPASLSWPAPQDLSAAGRNAFVPHVAIDSQDRATAVWQRSDGANDRIQAVRIGADGTPGAVADLSAAGEDAHFPQVAIDSQDRATVVWHRSDGVDQRVQAVRIGADGTPGAVADLSAAGEPASGPQVAIDSQDRATVVWRRPDISGLRIQAVRIGADGTPGTVADLSEAGEDALEPQVAIDSQDRATVVWLRFDGWHDRVQAVRIGADGAPGAVADLSPVGRDALDPRVAIDSQHRATVVWTRPDGANDRIQAVRIAADGTPQTVADLSAAGGNASVPRVAIDSQDRATVAWNRFDGATQRVQAVRIGADGAPGAVADLSAAGWAANPQVAIDSQDRATVVWSRHNGVNERIQAVRGVLSAPSAPSFSSTAPASPANDNSPRLVGSADPASTVTVYATADCSGSPAATGSAAAFASPGLAVSVADNSTTTFHATATDSDGTSACSASSITYEEASPGPPLPDPTLEITGVERDRKRGTATLTAATNVAGQLHLAKSNKVKGFGPVQLNRAGEGELEVVPRKKAAKKLKRKRRLSVSLKVILNPAVGAEILARRELTLRRSGSR